MYQLYIISLRNHFEINCGIDKTRSHAGNRTRVLWVKATDASPYTTWEMSSMEIEQLYIYSVDTLRMCKLARHYMIIFKENVYDM